MHGKFGGDNLVIYFYPGCYEFDPKFWTRFIIIIIILIWTRFIIDLEMKRKQVLPLWSLVFLEKSRTPFR